MAAGRGVCLVAKRGVFTTYQAVLFDQDFNRRGELPLAGVPSRVQVAPDGKLAGTTVFVSGHSYSDGGFSTRTSIVDLDTGKWLVEDLETFTVRRKGQTIQAPDFNFWGVTFTRDARTFYATLGTGGETLLVKGDVDARTMDVIAESVECPSLSPDGRRVAFKQRSGGVTGPVTWRLWVLDLETGQRHPLAETRSVDDQAQWLDERARPLRAARRSRSPDRSWTSGSCRRTAADSHACSCPARTPRPSTALRRASPGSDQGQVSPSRSACRSAARACTSCVSSADSSGEICFRPLRERILARVVIS